MTTINVKSFTATGSGREIKIDPENWDNADGFAMYLLEYAAGVILQRSTAGKGDDPKKANENLEAAIKRLTDGEIPSGGGFSRLSDEDYALKEALTANKVKFDKGESVADCINRLAAAIMDEPELPEGVDADADILDEATWEGIEGFADYVTAWTEARDTTAAALRAEMEATEVYKSALKMRKAKAKTAVTGGLLGKLKK